MPSILTGEHQPSSGSNLQPPTHTHTHTHLLQQPPKISSNKQQTRRNKSTSLSLPLWGRERASKERRLFL